MFNKAVLLVFVLSLSLAGCTSLKKMTGQTNDTILPGAREDILPPDQQTARDPAITGGQPAPGGMIQQQTLAPPGQPAMPQTAQKGDLLPANNGTVVACDPLTQTCPGMEPQTKVAAKGNPAAGKVLVAPGGKVASSAKVKMAKATAGTPPTDAAAAGTDPMKPVVKPVKKKVKKKLVLKPETAAPAAPDAAAAPDATQPPPVVPPDVKTP